LLVFSSMLFGFTHHAVDIFFRERATTGDGDLLLFAGALVFGRNLNNTVGIDIEGDLNLWDSPRSRSNTRQLKSTQWLVIASELTLTLEYLDLHRWLVIF